MAGSIIKTALAALLLFQPWTAAYVSRHTKSRWVDIWGSMPQLVEPANLPPAPYNATGVVFQNATLRQTIFITQSAPTIRLVISNAFGGSDLPITAATIAVPLNGSAGTPAISPGSLAALTFSGGLTNFTIPNGARAVSDPIDYPVTAQQILTISLYLETGQMTNSITGHPGSRTTSYYSPGDQTASPDVLADPATQHSEHWYFISAVEGYLPEPASSTPGAALAIIGDSITDGRASTTNLNNRWPDVLLRRLQSPGSASSPQKHALYQSIAVINQAAGGNRVLADGLGPNALGRIDRDVLAHPGISYVLILEGVNDIGVAAADAASQRDIGDRLIAAYDQIVSMVHARGLPIFGGTITPFCGDASVQAYSDANREATRRRVNGWIRGSGRFDGVVDFDAAVRDPANGTMLNPAYDSGDYLHPNPAGYGAMADVVDLGFFERFRDGVDGVV
ncbi:hypothetical protein VP1G_04523 [Cytospora mali]|uniref:SGNH hydrolase-type esterase domain-containing protein n=1 Tax=Cytospora mali TaxID=578113 RepID=A0A194UZZ1_CYTMA|nr:hypothetical protein VP1G_04523 [Valsa mali var. pyri (nom. inval.)]